MCDVMEQETKGPHSARARFWQANLNTAFVPCVPTNENRNGNACLGVRSIGDIDYRSKCFTESVAYCTHEWAWCYEFSRDQSVNQLINQSNNQPVNKMLNLSSKTDRKTAQLKWLKESKTSAADNLTQLCRQYGSDRLCASLYRPNPYP